MLKPPADTRRYPFTHVIAKSLNYTQGEVHGLLGQRAIDPATPRPRPTVAPPLDLPLVGGERKDYDMLAENAEGPAVGAPRRRLAVSPSGHVPSQGEGFIEGNYKDYKVRELHSHSFRFSKLRC